MLSTPALSRYIELCMFQPFLRFYYWVMRGPSGFLVYRFQPFLRFYEDAGWEGQHNDRVRVSTLLEILPLVWLGFLGF